MSRYHPVSCSLSKDQARKLMSGGTVALRKSMLSAGGGFTVHLTKQQHNKLSKGSGGMRLHFSDTQRNHNLKHGAGFKDFLKGLIKSVAPAALDAGTNLLKNQGLATKLLTKINPKLGAALGSAADSALNAGLDAGNNAVQKKIAAKASASAAPIRATSTVPEIAPSSQDVQSVADATTDAPVAVNRGEGRGGRGAGIGKRGKKQGAGLYPAGYSGGGLMPPGYGGGLLPRPIKGVNSSICGI